MYVCNVCVYMYIYICIYVFLIVSTKIRAWSFQQAWAFGGAGGRRVPAAPAGGAPSFALKASELERPGEGSGFRARSSESQVKERAATYFIWEVGCQGKHIPQSSSYLQLMRWRSDKPMYNKQFAPSRGVEDMSGESSAWHVCATHCSCFVSRSPRLASQEFAAGLQKKLRRLLLFGICHGFAVCCRLVALTLSSRRGAVVVTV